MDWTFLLYILLSLINFLIAIYVYARDPRRLTNKVFAFLGGTIALWTLAIGHAYNPATAGLLFVRSAFASASLMLLGLLTLFFVFPSSPFPRRPLYIFPAIVSLVFCGLAFSPLLVTEFSQGPSEVLVSYGSLYKLFGLYVAACLGYCILILWSKFRTATGIARLQLRYLLLGLLLPGIAITITNLFIPLVFTTSRFGRYGPAFSLIFVGVTAHAIIRHRLMNIRLVIRRGVTYLITAAIAGGVFVGLVGFASTIVNARRWDPTLWIEAGLMLLVALLFQPLKRSIQTALDRYFYREPYDYRKTIRQTSRTMGTMLNLTPLLSYMCDVISRTVRPESISIYIKNSEGTDYTQTAFREFLNDESYRAPDMTLAGSSPLPRLLAHTRTYVLVDDFERMSPGEDTREILSELSRLRGQMVLPIMHEEELIGFIVLAAKLSGDVYFAEDIDLLSTLVGQAAIAIINAQLYQEVARVNEYVAHIVSTMESGVVAVGPNGTITLFNPSAERITGLRAVEVRSDNFHRLPAALAHSLEATLNDGQPRVQAETTIPDIVGRYTPVSCSTYALRDRLGTPLGAVAVFGDLTRLKELEGERRRAERLASFSALASGVAHEIKNPLVAIRTFAELLPERFTDEEFRGDFSRVVIQEIQRIDDLVARLRGLAVPSPQRLSPLDLRDPIEDTLALLRAQLEQKKIHLRRLFDPSLPTVSGDPAQLKQLFLNLFMNALEAMEPGGELTISLNSTSIHNTCTVVATVSDTGSGILDPLLPKIFDPFFTTKPRGTGLGLAICRGIADAHGATMRAANNPGRRGSTVAVEFPAAITMTVAIKA